METPFSYRALGIVFMILGICLGIAFALTLGPAFVGIGLTFVAFGIIFMTGSAGEDDTDG